MNFNARYSGCQLNNPEIYCTSMNLLKDFGTRVADLRKQRGLTREELARRSKLSARFLADVEGGKGNLSLNKLAALSEGLHISPSLLLAGLRPRNSTDSVLAMVAKCDPAQMKELQIWLKTRLNPKQNKLALIGLRGAGKTTIGKKLAKKLKWEFVELDERIEKTAGLTLQNIFELHGEEYYRRLEQDVLMNLILLQRPMVIATGGGIVTRNETYDLLQRNSFTIWLKADPGDHWNRVLQQDPRPMANKPDAFAQLQNILNRREPLYALADLTVNTSRNHIPEIVETIAERLRKT
jgi:XRE family aerobic/anaerobic benzoate catabolism transcriptional regulator